MNHGNINKSLDDSIDKLNKLLGKLLGKKALSTPPKKPLKKITRVNFSFLLAAMGLFLWLSSGIYYLSDKNYGLIFNNGKIIKVVNGTNVGITLPYPINQVVVIPKSGSNRFNASMAVVSNDWQNLEVASSFNYLLIDPQKFYINYYQDDMDLDQVIKWLVNEAINKYLTKMSFKQINQLLIEPSANNLLNFINLELAGKQIGIKLTSFKLISARQVLILKNQQLARVDIEESQSNLARQLIKQATDYRDFNLANTQNSISQYKQLLPQYQKNKRAIIDELYYQLINDVPITKPVKNYNLLDMSLAELKNQQQLLSNESTNNQSFVQQDVSHERKLSRDVIRQRNFRSL